MYVAGPYYFLPPANHFLFYPFVGPHPPVTSQWALATIHRYHVKNQYLFEIRRGWWCQLSIFDFPLVTVRLQCSGPDWPTINMPGAAAVLVTLLVAAGPHLYISISLVQLQPSCRASLHSAHTTIQPAATFYLDAVNSKISHLLYWLKAHMRVYFI